VLFALESNILILINANNTIIITGLGVRVISKIDDGGYVQHWLFVLFFLSISKGAWRVYISTIEPGLEMIFWTMVLDRVILQYHAFFAASEVLLNIDQEAIAESVHFMRVWELW